MGGDPWPAHTQGLDPYTWVARDKHLICLAGRSFSKLCDQKTSSDLLPNIWTQMNLQDHEVAIFGPGGESWQISSILTGPADPGSNYPRRTLEEPLIFLLASFLEDSLSRANH